jgi:hypothetical protein
VRLSRNLRIASIPTFLKQLLRYFSPFSARIWSTPRQRHVRGETPVFRIAANRLHRRFSPRDSIASCAACAFRIVKLGVTRWASQNTFPLLARDLSGRTSVFRKHSLKYCFIVIVIQVGGGGVCEKPQPAPSTCVDDYDILYG